MRLGTITSTALNVRQMQKLQNSALGPTGSRSNKIFYDDAAAAVIQNPFHAEDSGLGFRTSAASFLERIEHFAAAFSESLSRFRAMSGEVARGRFSPTVLRNQIKRLEEAISTRSAADSDELSGQRSALAFLREGEFKSASRGATETRSLAWLKKDSQTALRSQENISPGRVLLLLRGMINPGSSK